MTRNVPPPHADRRPHRVVGLAVSVALAGVAVVPAAASAAGVPVVVDTGRVVALAGDGTSAAWLRTTQAAGSRGPVSVTLRVRAADGTVTTVGQKMPSNASELAYGTDAKGVPTIVVAAGGRSEGDTTTLYALPADGSAAPRRLALSGVPGPESAPGLVHGAVSFTRRERTHRRGRPHDTVRVGSLDTARSRILSKGENGTLVDATVPTAGHGVAYVTEHAVGAVIHFDLHVLPPGHRSRVVSSTFHGQAAGAAFGALVPEASGSRFSVTRWNDDGGGRPGDRTVYRAPSGTRVSRTSLQPGELDRGVPVAGGVLYVDTEVAPDTNDEQLQFRPAA